MAKAPLKILWEDERVVAVSKPGGMLVHRTREAPDRRVVLQTLRRQIGTHLYPIHRLDRAASGVLLFAKTSEEARQFHRGLRQEATRKEYLVLARGDAPSEWEMSRPLTDDAGVPKAAQTSFVKIGSFFRCSLLQAFPSTGRRHQIRRHLAHCAHHILGDTTYGKGRINRFFRENHGLPRLFLHARRVELVHPETGSTYCFEDPLAKDLTDFLMGLPEFDRGWIGRL